MEIFSQFTSTPVATYINLIILLLFVIALSRFLKYHLTLKKEKKGLDHLRDIISKDESLTKEDLLIVTDKLNNETVVYKRLRTILELNRDNAELSYEIIEKINEKFPLKISNYAFLISSSLISLGLLGTIIGLSYSLSEIQGAMSFKSITDFKGDLESILAGMNTAFSTTILGLVFTLILLFILTYLRRFYNNLSLETDSYFNTTIAKFFIKQKSEYNYNSLIKSVTELTNQNKEVAKNFIGATENISDSQNVLIGVFENLRNSIQKIFTANNIEDLHKYQEQIRLALENNNQISKNLKDSSESIAKKTTENIEKITKLVETIEKQNTIVQNDLDQNRINYSKIEVFVEKLEELNSTYKKDRTEIKNNIETISKKIEYLIPQLNNAISGIKKAINEGLIQEITKSNQEVNQKVSEKILQVTNNINELTNSFGQLNKKIEEGINKVYKNTAEEIVKNLDTIQSKYEELFKNNFSNNEENIKGITASLQVNNDKIIVDIESNFKNIQEKQMELINSGYSMLFTSIDKLIKEKYDELILSKVNNASKNNEEKNINNEFIKDKESIEKIKIDESIKNNQDYEEKLNEENKTKESNIINEELIKLFNRQQVLLEAINENLIKLNKKSIWNFLKNIFSRN